MSAVEVFEQSLARSERRAMARLTGPPDIQAFLDDLPYSPEDAYRCFMQTEMDVLVIEDYLFLKADQPAWTGPVNAFAPD